MDLNSLKNLKIDVKAVLAALKNLSWNDIRNFINEQQVLALHIAIVLATVLSMAVIVNMRLQEYSSLKKQISDLAAKQDPSLRYEKILKQAKDFRETIPAGVPESEIISYVSQMATKRGIRISGFDAPRTINGAFYREAVVSLTAAGHGFKDILLFAHDLEASGRFVKINSISLRAENSGAISFSNEKAWEDPRLMMTLEISSIELMENVEKKSKK